MSLEALLKALAEIRISVRVIAGGMVAEWGFKTVFFTYQYDEVLYAEARRYVIDGEHVHFTWRELHSVVEIIAFFTE